MGSCCFVSDLHGDWRRYRKLFELMAAERPTAVFMGGDLLPSALNPASGPTEFLIEVGAELRALRARVGEAYPAVFLVLGNDDPRAEEETILTIAESGVWTDVHNRCIAWNGFVVYGYNCVPPTPFLLKDWERYDVSRYVDPGCVSPEEGWRTVAQPEWETRHATIASDLAALVGDNPLTNAIMLFHTPPYRTALDRIERPPMVDHAACDPHVGSVAVRRLIEQRQPLFTLHGHIHESARLTGSWRAVCGRTVSLTAAHDGPELALVRFDPEQPGEETRELC